MKFVLSGGRVVYPGGNLDDLREVMVEDGLIIDVVKPGQTAGFEAGAEIINVEGMVICPGLIDMHTHLREPGHEYKETIASGTAAAAAGGFTAVAAMPNTNPVNDNRAVTEFILAQADKAALSKVYPVAAMTVGSNGKELCQYYDLAEAGAAAVSDDGHPVSDSHLMRCVLEYAAVFGLPALSHCEETGLSGSGVMNEGVVSTKLGLPGIPAQAEEIGIFRDIQLAGLTKTSVHIQHVSTAGSVDIIRRAKARGISVTAETAPHYFTLDQTAVLGYRTEAKMNPPLRTRSDVEAIRQGLADGTLDAIATDHAPHSILEKEVEFDQASFGIIGLETALPLSLNLVADGLITLTQMVTVLSVNPAKILRKPGGSLAKGQPADITVMDIGHEWDVEPKRFKSLSRNNPFSGVRMTGKAVMTIVDGRIVYHNQ